MLKQELCKKCRNIFADSFGKHRNVVRWADMDERYWKEGIVFCPTNYLEKGEMIEGATTGRKTTELPPNKCPYYLENLI